MTEPLITTYVITENPSDYPGLFVVREQHVIRGQQHPVAGDVLGTADTLDGVRELLPPGLVYADFREPDPVFVGGEATDDE